MKPVFGIVAVFAFLLAMLPGIGCADGTTPGEPVEEAEVSEETGELASQETPSEAEVVAEPETPAEIEEPEEAESALEPEASDESEVPTEDEPSAGPEAPADSGPELVPATGLEQAYMQSVIEYVSAIGDSVNQIGNLLAEPAPENEQWMLLLNAYVAQVEGSPDAFEEVDPPPALENFYDVAVELLEHCSTFAELVGETVEDGDPEVPEDAVQELVKADESLAEMGVVMTAFLELHPMYAE